MSSADGSARLLWRYVWSSPGVRAARVAARLVPRARAVAGTGTRSSDRPVRVVPDGSIRAPCTRPGAQIDPSGWFRSRRAVSFDPTAARHEIVGTIDRVTGELARGA